jgi:hypothetical protein
MRRIPYSYVRGVSAVLAAVVLSLSVAAGPRENQMAREPRVKRDPIVKIVKRIIKSLGDGLTVPTPCATP